MKLKSKIKSGALTLNHTARKLVVKTGARAGKLK